jgi:hypothetical protein
MAAGQEQGSPANGGGVGWGLPGGGEGLAWTRQTGKPGLFFRYNLGLPGWSAGLSDIKFFSVAGRVSPFLTRIGPVCLI